MKTRRSRVMVVSAVVILALGLAVASLPGLGRAQDDQQSSQGPGSNAGQTVYAPKKTKPGQQPVPSPNAPTQPSYPAEQQKPEKINPNSIYTLSTTSNLVNVNVLVTDNNGNPIPNLKKDNFRISDDGVPQTVTNFSTAEAPMTVCMLIEFSDKFWGYLELALQDAYQFLGFMKPQDWVAVISFDMKPHILQDFTHSRAEVRSALDSLRMPGFSESNLYDATAFTLNRMQKIQGRKAILVITTGCDTFSKLTLDKFLKVVKGSNTPIYPVSIMEFLVVRYGENISCGPGTVGFGGGDYLQARNTLMNMAKDSGGTAYFPRFEQDIPNVYEQIAGQLRHEYSLGFIPTDSSQDGKFHKLKVELVDGRGQPLKIVNQKGKKVKYRVVSREGYYATKTG